MSRKPYFQFSDELLNKMNEPKFQVFGGTEEQNKLIQALLESQWPIVEPLYREVFGQILFEQLRSGIETTRKDLESGALEVLNRAGLVPRKIIDDES